MCPICAHVSFFAHRMVFHVHLVRSQSNGQSLLEKHATGLYLLTLANVVWHHSAMSKTSHKCLNYMRRCRFESDSDALVELGGVTSGALLCCGFYFVLLTAWADGGRSRGAGVNRGGRPRFLA
jgi:hypothetical protein